MAQCRSCDADNPVDAKFCMQCGQPMRQACASCGADLPAEARFCAQCGAPAAAGSAIVEESANQAAQLPAALGGGRFRLEKQIGEGSKKRVYLARDTRLDRQVALSLLKTDGLDANTFSWSPATWPLAVSTAA
jgi:ribosomal protein L40E